MFQASSRRATNPPCGMCGEWPEAAGGMLSGGPGGTEVTLSISCVMLQGIGELPLAEMLQPEVQLQPLSPWESAAHSHQSHRPPDVHSGWLRHWLGQGAPAWLAAAAALKLCRRGGDAITLTHGWHSVF